MTINLLFIDRLKVLYRNLIRGKNIAPNRPVRYEVDILPSSMKSGSQQTPSSDLDANALVASVAAPRLAAGVDRLRRGRQGRGRDLEHTHSNLG